MPVIMAADLAPLEWHPHREGGAVPASKPDGAPMRLAFVNARKEVVKFHQMDPDGTRGETGQVEPGATVETQGSPGSVWAITGDGGEPLGHFIVADRAARAEIP